MTQTCLSLAEFELLPAAHHHRTLWGDMDALRDSIASLGILQPLVVRRTAAGYEIVDGVRRRRAGIAAGITTFPCVLVDVDEKTAIVMQVDANLKRADMHPIDEALYCAELSTRGLAPDEIAGRLGLSRRRIVRRMALLALCPVARAAFVASTIDEDAALALARVDETQQARIVSSIEANALQPEEVPAYVSRIFTANLDDVPWRVSDEKHVPSAGPCTTCQKRSDVQRDLFPETVTRLRCLDVDCYRAKMDVSYGAVLKTHSPLRVLGQRPGDLFLPMPPGRPVVIGSSGMVDSDSPCKLIEGLTWGESAARATTDSVSIVWLARDQDGRPRYLLKEEEVTKLVKGSDAAIEAKAAREAADPTPAETNRAKTKQRRAVLGKLTDLVVSGDHDTWSWVVERMVDEAAPRTAALASTALAGAISLLGGTADGKPALIALTRSSNRGARRVAATLAILGDTAEDATLDELARACGTTMAAIVAGFES